MTTEEKQDSDKSERLSSLLKRLPRETAPWHFEARLRQLLAAEKSKKRPLVLRPAFALPLAGAAAALVLYLSSPFSEKNVPEFPPPLDSLEQPRPSGARSQEKRSTQQRRETLQPETSPQKGPSAGSSDSFLPAAITPSESNGRANPMSLPIVVPGSADSGFRFLVAPDSADTLRKPLDSLAEDK